MEQILLNLQSPDWWFTGTFFVLLGLVLSFFISKVLPAVWGKISIILPRLTKRFSRRAKCKQLRIIKSYRQHEVRVYWLICRYWALVVLAALLMAYISITYATAERVLSIIQEFWRFLPAVLPLYLINFIVLKEKKLLSKVIKAHINWKRSVKND
ncbi:hypothetical protein DC365_23730 [Vibrio vulnificus]|uniref:hypothetical protein n=1 Tax=Vibrio vulnificus TaxID=672 RepID=UPI0005C76411|nr:hypothetical protein VVS222_03339 [Vibrio vulnificus]PNM96917.1 hypothetical protein AL547_022265 [Vibrio vulnificus]POB55225.1 hypothetical protein CRN26_08310 [Vibrio vulnificus]PUZ80700.1 hypothetical protein DC360_22035 [Vibrio vulnificus]PUZ92318.1 hypothetical protein DC365_23730 [Vibrio vulnificus]